MDWVAIIKEFGFPITLCAALLWAIRAQNAQLVKSYTNRILALEGLVRTLGDKVATIESDRLKRSDEYAMTLRDVAIRWSSTIKDHNELTKRTLDVLRRIADDLTERPCLGPPLAPSKPQGQRYKKTPSSAEIPVDPARIETDKLGRT